MLKMGLDTGSPSEVSIRTIFAWANLTVPYFKAGGDGGGLSLRALMVSLRIFPIARSPPFAYPNISLARRACRVMAAFDTPCFLAISASVPWPVMRCARISNLSTVARPKNSSLRGSCSHWTIGGGVSLSIIQKCFAVMRSKKSTGQWDRPGDLQRTVPASNNAPLRTGGTQRMFLCVGGLQITPAPSCARQFGP